MTAEVSEEMETQAAAAREYLFQLHQTLARRFDLEELRTLCFTLGIDFEDLPGAGKSNKARDLVVHLGRRGQVQELIQMGQRLRSDVDWEPVPPELAPLIPMAVEVIAAPPDRTKVTPPPEPSRPPQVTGFVGREAELAVYADRLANDQLAVIAGMAGVGKTALAVTLAQRVADPEHTFWHTFHEGEGVDALLWKLAGFLAWRGQGDLWGMLQGAQQSGGQPPPTEVLLDYLFQTLRRRGYTLCLDDWHLVEEDPLLEQLVERMYRLVRAGELALIVTSRRAPAFADETAFEPLAGLCASDTQALVAARGLALPEALVADLHAYTEGNAELLTLAMGALERARDPAHLVARLAEAGSVARFLMKEVDAGLTEAERDVMEAVAILLGYPATRDAVEALLENGRGTRRALHELSARYLLTVSQCEWGSEYNQHALVREFYYDLLGRRERHAMHSRAGSYYEHEEPDVLKAARHYERAGEKERAAQLVSADVQTLIGQGQAWAVRQLLEGLMGQPLSPATQAGMHEALGDLQYLLGELDEALTAYEAAVGASEQALVCARLRRKQGEVLARQGKYDQALERVARGRDALTGVAEAKAEAAQLAVVYGTVMLTLGRYDEAATAAETALERLPEPTANARVAADLHDLLGKVCFYSADTAHSLEHFQSALELRRADSDLQGMIKSYSNLAVVHGEQNRYAEALEANQAALEIAERIGDVVALGVINMNIAGDAMEQGAYERAIEHSNLSLALRERIGDTQGLSEAYHNLGEVYRRTEQFDLAEEHLLEAVELAERVGDRPGVVIGTQTLAEVYLAQNRLDEALVRCEASLRLAEEIGDRLSRPWGLHLLGRIRHRLHQWDKSRSAFSDAGQMWREHEAWHDLASNSLFWARLERDAGQVGRARELCAQAAALAHQVGADDLLRETTALLADLESKDEEETV